MLLRWMVKVFQFLLFLGWGIFTFFIILLRSCGQSAMLVVGEEFRLWLWSAVASFVIVALALNMVNIRWLCPLIVGIF